MTNNRLQSNIVSVIFLIVFGVASIGAALILLATPTDSTKYDLDGQNRKEHLASISETRKISGVTEIYAPGGNYYSTYTYGPHRTSKDTMTAEGNTKRYIGDKVELIQAVRTTEATWVHVYDFDKNKEYWTEYPATVPTVPKVDWDN
jgi:hypothetical protein